MRLHTGNCGVSCVNCVCYRNVWFYDLFHVDMMFLTEKNPPLSPVSCLFCWILHSHLDHV